MIRLFSLLSIGLLSIITTKTYAQTTDTTKQRTIIELGMNVTSTLSSFLGSGTNPSTDPYLVSLKFVKNNQATRLAFDVDVNNKTEDDPNFGGKRKTYDYNLGFKVGYEKRIPMNKHFGFYWGVDGILGYQNSKVDFFSQFGQVTTNTKGFNVGAAPLIGFRYDINRRIALSTEASVAAIYSVSTEQIDDNFSIFASTQTTRFDLSTSIPNTLYVIIKF